ncbi:MAG: VWA domain-containing protein, partial [Lentisphaerae bacterium]|nr:VWA domain-containing protein [Lentisphaerota bacterium]
MFLFNAVVQGAVYVDRGHCGFVMLEREESTVGSSFKARVEGEWGSGDVAEVRARLSAEGWQIFMGGWPAGIRGSSDLVLTVTERGAQREIRLPGVVRWSGRRMDVALVIDDSFSMRKTDPQRLRVKGLELFAEVASGRGAVATLTVIGFNRYPRMLLPPTPPGNGAAFAEAMRQLVAEGTTDLDAALDMAGETLAQLPDSRKIVVVLSDGKDEPGRYEEAHRQFIESGIPVYTVGLSRLADRRTLGRVASETGGAFWFAPDMTRLEAIFQSIVLTIHQAVTVGKWELDGGERVAVPVDESMSLVAFRLEGRECDRAEVVTADGIGKFVFSTETLAGSYMEHHRPKAGRWQAGGTGTLTATAESDLELVVFPQAGTATEAQPQEMAALVLRRGAVVSNGVDVVVATAHGGAKQRLTQRQNGIFSGVVVPVGSGEQEWQVVAVGETEAGHDFQRQESVSMQVKPTRRDTLWVQPEPLRVSIWPGCERVVGVALAGRGNFSAKAVLARGLVGGLEVTKGALPEGETLSLPLRLKVPAKSKPGVYKGEVTVNVGRLPTAQVALEVVVPEPRVKFGPAALGWEEVAAGSVVTGEVYAVTVAEDKLCSVAAVIQGVGHKRDVPLDAMLGTKTNIWQLVVDTAGVADEISGKVVLSWGWDSVAIPWAIKIARPDIVPAMIEEEPILPEVEVEAEREEVIEYESEKIAGPELPLAALVAEEPLPVMEVTEEEGGREAVSSQAKTSNYWRIGFVVLLIVLLLYLLWRMTDSDEERLFKYYAASVVLHLLVFILTLDLLVQTRVVALEDISPSLALSISVMEERLGITLAPAVGAVKLDEQARRAEIVKMGAKALQESRTRLEVAQEELAVSDVSVAALPEAVAEGEAQREAVAEVVRAAAKPQVDDAVEEMATAAAKRIESGGGEGESGRQVAQERGEAVQTTTTPQRELMMVASAGGGAAVGDVSV